MKTRLLAVSITLTIIALTMLSQTQSSAAQSQLASLPSLQIQRVSVASDGTQGNDGSDIGGISADGQFFVCPICPRWHVRFLKRNKHMGQVLVA